MSNLVEYRKASYDEAVKSWNKDLASHLLTFREFFGTHQRVFLEDNIESDLNFSLRAVDNCITEAYKSSKNKTPTPIYCKINIDGYEHIIKISNLIQSANLCGLEIINTTFSMIHKNRNIESTWWKNGNPEKARENIKKTCRNLIIERTNAWHH